MNWIKPKTPEFPNLSLSCWSLCYHTSILWVFATWLHSWTGRTTDCYILHYRSHSYICNFHWQPNFFPCPLWSLSVLNQDIGDMYLIFWPKLVSNQDFHNAEPLWTIVTMTRIHTFQVSVRFCQQWAKLIETRNNGFLYYAMYCIHYTGIGTETGNHCFLLCPFLSRSRSRSHPVCMSH